MHDAGILLVLGTGFLVGLFGGIVLDRLLLAFKVRRAVKRRAVKRLGLLESQIRAAMDNARPATIENFRIDLHQYEEPSNGEAQE